MAFYGGVASGRPWPKIDGTIVVIAASILFVIFVAISLLSSNSSTPAVSTELTKNSTIPAGMAEVLVARMNISQGQKVDIGMFKRKIWPTDGIEDKIVKNAALLKDKYAATLIVANTPLLDDYLSESVPTNLITVRIPEGYRAVAIPVDAQSGVEGWARAGAKVDVVLTTKEKNRLIVSTIVENAEILSAGRSVEVAPSESTLAGSPIPSFVTLMVSYKDSQKIQLAKSTGNLSLSLRGDADSQSVGSETLSSDNLLKSDLDNLTATQGTVEVDGKTYSVKGRKLEQVSGNGKKY